MIDLDSILDRATAAARGMAQSTLDERANWLTALADALDSEAELLIELAARETHLSVQRLTGELARTTFQLRLIAEAVLEGSWLEATIDHADPDWPMGARPDLRRMLRPLGPVLVVAASNFPFAFSVAGGDTATALGAGCPVVLKAHPGHPELSRRTARTVVDALAAAGAPEGAFALVEDEETARAALGDPRVKAGSFTGSVTGGRALFDLAAARPDPIPFYGELGSTNPAFVLPTALDRRRHEVLEGFVTSFTMGAGQFCTKPGVLFVPRRGGVREDLSNLVRATTAAPMLNEKIAAGLRTRLDTMRDDWEVLVDGTPSVDGATPTLFATTVANTIQQGEALFEEAFGPTAVLVEYDDPAELLAAAEQLPGQLTATVHADEDDQHAPALLNLLAGKAGRIVWNGWPTGVSVTWAMQHGGTWPATTASIHTSVGPTGLRRFLTPLALQDVPTALLPELLRDTPRSIWRRVDGQLTAPSPHAR